MRLILENGAYERYVCWPSRGVGARTASGDERSHTNAHAERVAAHTVSYAISLCVPARWRSDYKECRRTVLFLPRLYSVTIRDVHRGGVRFSANTLALPYGSRGSLRRVRLPATGRCDLTQRLALRCISLDLRPSPLLQLDRIPRNKETSQNSKVVGGLCIFIYFL